MEENFENENLGKLIEKSQKIELFQFFLISIFKYWIWILLEMCVRKIYKIVSKSQALANRALPPK